jgi:hypothetical protein
MVVYTKKMKRGDVGESIRIYLRLANEILDFFRHCVSGITY